jgi:GAF domain-containing protein
VLAWRAADRQRGHVRVVAVQSYTSEVSYNQRDAELLTFVSYQLASSIQRRRTAEALRLSNIRLEERVEERTLGDCANRSPCANRSKRSCSTRSCTIR